MPLNAEKFLPLSKTPLDLFVPVKFRSKAQPPGWVRFPELFSQRNHHVLHHPLPPEGCVQGKVTSKTRGDTLKHFFTHLKASQGTQKYPEEAADEWLQEGGAGAGGLSLPGWSCEQVRTIYPGGDRAIRENEIMKWLICCASATRNELSLLPCLFEGCTGVC